MTGVWLILSLSVHCGILTGLHHRILHRAAATGALDVMLGHRRQSTRAISPSPMLLSPSPVIPGRVLKALLRRRKVCVVKSLLRKLSASLHHGMSVMWVSRDVVARPYPHGVHSGNPTGNPTVTPSLAIACRMIAFPPLDILCLLFSSSAP